MRFFIISIKTVQRTFQSQHRYIQMIISFAVSGSAGKTFLKVSAGALQFRRWTRLTPELLEKVLIGWPSPTAGVRDAMVTEQRFGTFGWDTLEHEENGGKENQRRY